MTGDDIDSSLDHEAFLLAVHRDMRLSPGELAAANRALAEHWGFPWRPEWVVSDDGADGHWYGWKRAQRGGDLPRR